MTYFIDAHEDIAYNVLNFGRDIRRAAADTRRSEQGGSNPAVCGGDTLLGWPDYQRGQVALVCATIFLSPADLVSFPGETQSYATPAEASRRTQTQIDTYKRLSDEQPEMFRLVRTRRDLQEVLAPWQAAPAAYPESTHPTGIVLLLEGAEGLENWELLELYWEQGLRLIGPVWGGGRFCEGRGSGGFTREGLELLERMAEHGYVLDISHMNEVSALTALDRYAGQVVATHANCRALIRNPFPPERHLTDLTLRRLIERGGVMGVLPFNRFLVPDWQNSDPREQVTLDTLAEHIDHVCQLAGSANHVAIGTDFDGGFGYPAVPLEINTIADLPKLEGVLAGRGYSAPEIDAVAHANWQRVIELTLPA